MKHGANSVHNGLKNELKQYIKSQYLGKNELLLNVVGDRLDEEGILYQKPFIESSPAYLSINDGIKKSNLQDWEKDFLLQLANEGLGIFTSPFKHQIDALEASVQGKDLFVATGTGSGKTECFMWPLLLKLVNEARNNSDSWEDRSIRAIIMYPMNALVSDQISRLRRLIGDKDDKFIGIFRNICNDNVRRPQFGMYTGRTPYPGLKPNRNQDYRLSDTLSSMVYDDARDEEKVFIENLQKNGKIPAKKDLLGFLEKLENSMHYPDDEDAELITRFEMQKVTPDILITNYSMLEYMLFRPREKNIWDDTKTWLAKDRTNKLLFIIDEAHMYKGSSGGEVALLIRRLFEKVGINRNQVQFILTTASMPNNNEEDRKTVLEFAKNLTAANDYDNFCYLTGERENIEGKVEIEVKDEVILQFSAEDFENSEYRLENLNRFWRNCDSNFTDFVSLEDLYEWMYNHLVKYSPFYHLMKSCRGTAVSLQELANGIFLSLDKEDALKAVSVLLAIAPLAK
ncbi:MAG: DEAD/DEAH box helicase, partial [Bacilli bacterium]|nr:DEAD/DEAH box helicase [Bacilli bacterium]